MNDNIDPPESYFHNAGLPVALTSVVEPALTPEVLIAKAIQAGVSADTMERLLAMRTKLREEQAKEAFDRALADFQSECPQVKKTKQVFNKDGRTVRYRYAPLEHIIDQVKGALTKHGFSYTLDAKVEPGWVEAICVATHSQGHSKPSSFKVPVEKDAFMNEQQKFASALTFCKRYAFCNAFGILCCDEDDDSVSASPQPESKLPSKPVKIPLKPAAEQALIEQQRKEKFLIQFKGLESYAVDLWKEMGILLPNEEFNDFPKHKVPEKARAVWDMVQEVKKRAGVGKPPECPQCKSSDYTEIKQGNKTIRRCNQCKHEWQSVSGTEQSAGEVLEQLEPKSKPIPENALSVSGTIMTISEKKGTKTDQQGKIQPWTRYGIKDNNGNWYNTFDKKLAQAAKELMDSKQTCQFVYTEGKFGKDLVNIE